MSSSNDVVIEFKDKSKFGFDQKEFDNLINIPVDSEEYIKNAYHIILNKYEINDDNKHIFKIFPNLLQIDGVPEIKTQDLSHMFEKTSIRYGELNKWDVSNVRNMEYMFSNSKYVDPLGDWNVSGVENMSFMFYNSKYNQPLNNWKVTDVDNMESMFELSYYTHTLEDWKVSGVKNMKKMFYRSRNKLSWFNNWIISKETDKTNMYRGI